MILQDIGPTLQQIQLANVTAQLAKAVTVHSSPTGVAGHLELISDGDNHTKPLPKLEQNDWVDWTLTKVVKVWFKDADIITSPTGWTTFANRLRNEGLIENHPARKATMIRVHRSVFARYGMTLPDITSK